VKVGEVDGKARSERRVASALHVARGSSGERKVLPAKRNAAPRLAKSRFTNEGFRSLTAGVAKALKNDIVRGAHLPNAKLRIAQLAEFYGVSPGAVREALSRLVSEGLVEFNEQRGFRAAPVSEADLIDITRTRVTIECEALRAAMRNGTLEWEREVMDSVRKLNRAPLFKRGADVVDGGWALLHRKFHRTLLAPCGSEWLLRFQATLFEQTERYRALEGLTHKKPERSHRDVAGEHMAIARAVATRNVRLGTTLLERHYMRTVEILLQNRSALTAAGD
jgi:DNA-binding GntR family transcriptional regulator